MTPWLEARGDRAAESRLIRKRGALPEGALHPEAPQGVGSESLPEPKKLGLFTGHSLLRHAACSISVRAIGPVGTGGHKVMVIIFKAMDTSTKPKVVCSHSVLSPCVASPL